MGLDVRTLRHVADRLLDLASPATAAFRAAIDERISAFLDGHTKELLEMSPDLGPIAELTGRLLGGGKRLRPAFCVAGYLAAAGPPEPELLPGLLDAGASLELLHVSALVHDDVMDGSDLRRGQPAAHRQFETLHTTSGWLGDPDSYGQAAAILLGDLLLMWSVEMLRAADLPADALAAAAPIAETMRTEVTAGQYLDVVAQVRPLEDTPGDLAEALAEASRVVELKSARYTVQRPVQLGAALGGGSPALQEVLSGYGIPLGRAFQFRDDLLGVFGDPAVTGKPAGDDLREGKRTVLVAHAYASTTAEGQRLLRRHLGDPALDSDGVRELRRLIRSSGAAQAVEQMIDDAYAEAVGALSWPDVTSEGREALRALAAAAAHRTS
jgi:geranylgeranyl diphosphate synthase, type I